MLTYEMFPGGAHYLALSISFSQLGDALNDINRGTQLPKHSGKSLASSAAQVETVSTGNDLSW